MNDVIVLGAGPAGSTVAHLLARRGLRVQVLEKETFPRFHIGESMLPMELPLFERLGFEPDRTRFVYKAGADFYDERTGQSTHFPFTDAMEGTPAHAWQVERARFDAELATLAEEAGAKIAFGTKVTDSRVLPDAVEVDAGDATYRARYLVDASGQDAWLGRRGKLLHPVRGFGIVAAFCHFSGLSAEHSAELLETGNVKILLLEHGWSWLIPLSGGRVGFGVVTRDKVQGTELLDQVYERSPLVQRLTAGATRTAPRLIRHFAYFNREPYGARYACVGDAAAFLDPVFSSGLSLAMQGAEKLADTLAPALAAGDEARDDLMEPVRRHMRHAYVTYGSLIKSFYHTNLVKHFFFHPEPDPALRAGLITLLAGDVWRDDNPFQQSLIHGRRRWEPEHELEPGA